jgi:hypothetical protein
LLRAVVPAATVAHASELEGIVAASLTAKRTNPSSSSDSSSPALIQELGHPSATDYFLLAHPPDVSYLSTLSSPAQLSPNLMAIPRMHHDYQRQHR